MRDTRHTRFGSLERTGAQLAICAALLVAGCGGDGQAGETGDAIDRAVFIDAYIDLRVAALRTDSLELSDEARAEVLGRHGVSAEDLVNFGEVHGRELEFMRDVWNEVEQRMDEIMPDGSR